MRTQQNYPQSTDFDFEQFFRENQKPIERFVSARIGSLTDREDVVSEAMCQFLAYCRSHPQREGDPRALLYKIIRRRIADYYEQRKREQRVKPLEETPPIAAPGSIPAMIDTKDELDATRAVLMTLREEYREAITLHAIVGLSIREIAELMEKPEVNVRVLLFRARRSLRRALRQSNTDTDHYGASETVDQP